MNMIEKMYAGKAGLSIFRFKSLLVCCAAFLCVASCDNPEKKLDEVDAEVSVNVESLEFGWEGGSQTIEITANQSWTVSGPEWLKFEPSKGDGNATVTVTADPSERFDDGEKTYSIVVRCGNRSAVVTVHRDSKPSSRESKLYLYEDGGVEVRDGIINFDGSTYSYVNTHSNADVRLEVLEGADWVIPIVENTKTDNYFSPYNLVFKVLPNNTREKRHAKIAIQTTPATDTPEIIEFDQQDGSLRADLLEIAEALHMDEWDQYNRWNKDEKALSWSGVYLNDNYEIETLQFIGTGIRGDFPEAICNLTTLEKLYIREDGLTGHLPESLGKLTKLKGLFIFGGNMEGTIPDVFGSMQDLESIALTSNRFSGSLPASLGDCPKLTEIRICGNEVTGSVPESWCRTDKTLELDSNFLSGQFPDAFYTMPSAVRNFSFCYAQKKPYRIDVSNAMNIKKYIEADPLVDLFGSSFCVSDIIKANKYTVFLNWGTWCPFSDELMPAVKEYYGKYHSKGLEIIAYAPNESKGEQFVRDFVREHGYDRWYNVSAVNGLSYPTSVPVAEIVDSEGNIIFTYRDAYDPILNRFSRTASFELIAFLEDLMGPLEEPDHYASKDYSQDGRVVTLQKATVGRGINLVLMGDGYTDKDIASGTYETLMRDAMDQFFDIEPYRSFRNRFNVYAVNVVSRNGRIGEGYTTSLNSEIDGSSAYISCDYDKCFEYALKVPSINNRKDLTIIVMANSNRSCGTTTTWYDDCSSVAVQSSHNNQPSLFGPTVQHEAGGHGFAFLGDEYDKSYGEKPSADQIAWWQKQYKEKGWYANVDFTSDPSKVKWSRFLNDDRYKGETGIYEGGMGYSTGVYRPAENSMMRENWGGFNAPSREAIYKRIMELSGEGYSWDAFTAYDVINR